MSVRRSIISDVKTPSSPSHSTSMIADRAGGIEKVNSMSQIEHLPTLGRLDKTRATLTKISNQKLLLIMLLPVMLYYVVFHYAPMYGVVIAFKQLRITQGILASPWVGFAHFVDVFTDERFYRVLTNTIVISLYQLVIVFPAPIIVAILLNEMQSLKIRRLTQTIIYLPRFLSWTIIAGLMVNIFSLDYGLLNRVLVDLLGMRPLNLLTDRANFRHYLVLTLLWRATGWSSIIYFAAMSALNPELYDSAHVDGAGRWRCIWHITLPGIMPTISILLILRIGNMLDVGFEQVFNLYNPAVLRTGDILDTFVFRIGIQEGRYSYATAVGLFRSVVALILILGANKAVKKMGQEGFF